ncbi:MAG: endonuclease/exonuclease/phosphatase family protein [Actinomycetota bacterium]
MTTEPRPTTRFTGPGWVAPGVVLAAAPWTWFLLRDMTPIMDVAAVALPLMASAAGCAAAVVAGVRRSPLPTLVAASFAAFTLVAVLGPRVPIRDEAPVRPVRLASANVYERNRNEGSARALLDQGADVLVVIEGAPAIGDGLAGAYPYLIQEGFLSVRSSFPARELSSGAALNGARLLRVRIWGPSGPFVLYALHSLNPLYDAAFDAQLGFLQDLLGRIERESQPVVIAGDFNMSDRSQGYRLVTGSLNDAMRAGWARSTYSSGPWQVLFLRIDYIFTTPSWCAADAVRFDVPGSDHEGVATTIGPCPGVPIPEAPTTDTPPPPSSSSPSSSSSTTPSAATP